jgi:hypothetical protein
MSRILEFQPTDEHTVVARVLVELHQAIDIHFPGANPSARQFTKTVLTNQAGEATRVDNAPAVNTSADLPKEAQRDRQNGAAPRHRDPRQEDPKGSHLSLTPRTKKGNKKQSEDPLATDELRHLMGETSWSRRLRQGLTVSLLVGILVFLWIYFDGSRLLALLN